ncbi:MAG: dockerin type I repeat-containing protein [Ruminococcus sp.]|nr:dockerin type I repeat-containing protein [Ruminococcus sp.]
MKVGETREGRFYNPKTMEVNGGSVKATSDTVSVEYTKGSGTFRVTALKEGVANLSINEGGCPFTGYVSFRVAASSTTDTVMPTTMPVTTTTVHIDYMTQVDYDKSPMKVGEVRRINFSHPTGETTGGSVYSSSDLIEIIYENGNNYFDVKALKEGEASVSVHARGCAFDPTVTIQIIASDPEITTSEEPEVWMYGTGVDHFDGVKTLPTKTIYDEGEELDLSGLVINAYHSVMRHSNKGNAEYLKTDYVWEIEDIAPEYITISSLTGKNYTADQFPTLIGGNAYTVKIGKRGSTMITLKVKGEQSEKELYDFESFTFRIYINPADKHSEFIRIDNAEVETFGYGTTSHGFKLKGMEAFSIDMDAYMHAGYEIEGGIQEGDSVSGVLYINPKNYYIYFGDLDIVKYGGVNGDANADGSVDMADAVLIMQALANPNKYGIGGMDARCMTKRGFALADQNGDGITVLDAQLIQNKLLGLS